jgi:hypothetical protein
MNPAMLLDPKGSRKRGRSPTSPTSHSSPSPSTFASNSPQLFKPNPFKAQSYFPIHSAEHKERSMELPNAIPAIASNFDDAAAPTSTRSCSGSVSSTPAISIYDPAENQQNFQPTFHCPVNSIFHHHPPSPLHNMNNTIARPGIELIDKGEIAAQPQSQPQNPRGMPQFQPYTYDPRALLNPKSMAKRPASEAESEVNRGRDDPTIAGQVSLVERLHNVHERTASPSKRARTDDQRPKPRQQSNIGGGSTLKMQQHAPNQSPAPTSGPAGGAIDLTMSGSNSFTSILKLRC